MKIDMIPSGVDLATPYPLLWLSVEVFQLVSKYNHFNGYMVVGVPDKSLFRDYV